MSRQDGSYLAELAAVAECDLLAFVSVCSWPAGSIAAGYVGTPSQWRPFEHEWRTLLAAEGIDNVAFRANDVIRGTGAYEFMSREQRERIQRALIAAIAAAGVMGTVSAVGQSRPAAFDRYVDLIARQSEPQRLRTGFVLQHDSVEIRESVSLGPIIWDDPKHAVGLAAAEMLAACACRQLSGDPTPWQWDALDQDTDIITRAPLPSANPRSPASRGRS